MTVVGSKAELLERAVGGTEGLEELHRPWIDDVVIRCGECAGEARRVADVGDAWLDAGIVPFSTLGWHNETFVEAGYAEGAGVGRHDRRPARSRELGEVVPGRLGVGDARADPALVLLDALHGGRAGRPLALPAGAHLREGERRDRPPMHKSWGNAIWFEDAIEEMGADVMRWMYAAQPPAQNLNFGYGRAGDVKRRLLTLWNTYAFFVTYAGINELPARALRRSTDGPGAEGIAAARPLGRRAHAGARARVPGGARHLRLAPARARLRGPRRRPLELVRAALAVAVLEVRRRGLDAGGPRDAVVCARPGGALRRAGDAVPGRRDVAEPRARPVRRRGAERPPRHLSRAGRRPRRPGPGRGARLGADGRRARPPGPLRGQPEAAPAAAPR